MDEMDLEDSAREKENQKLKRAEEGASPDLKRARLAELYSAQIPGDTEMESQGKKYEDEDDGEYVEDDDEFVDDDDDDDDEEPPEMTQEQKDFMRKAKESLIKKFGTADSLEIDMILRKEEEEEERNKVKKEETEEEKKEKIRIEEILNHVDGLTVLSCYGTCRSGSVGNLNFILLNPWLDMDCTKGDMMVRSLDMYYKRLMPNPESASIRYSPALWNRLPEVDVQYVLLYNKLDTLFQQESVREMTPKDLCKAEDEAKALNLWNLGLLDIIDCLNDVFMERDTIAEHKLRTEYDLYLLECLLHKKRPEDFILNDPSEISHNTARVCSRIQQGYWSSRIRYIKFKRALAKELKLISEEA